jgi:sugar O-acyltransferase (sialic acid O-acetyltransferase NeuD family)
VPGGSIRFLTILKQLKSASILCKGKLPMAKKVVIFGATEMAMMSHFYLSHDSPYDVVAFTVDRQFIKEETLCGLPVLPFDEIQSVYPPTDYRMQVAIMYGRLNRTRAEKYYQAKQKGYELVSYVSSKALTWPGLIIGDNCLILESCVISPFAKIANDVVMTPGCVINHHSTIEDHCFLGAHVVVLGHVTVQPYCFLGANSTIRDGVSIARECIIGAGALITRNTKERGVYIGNPAEPVPKPSNELGALLTWDVDRKNT